MIRFEINTKAQDLNLLQSDAYRASQSFTIKNKEIVKIFTDQSIVTIEHTLGVLYPDLIAYYKDTTDIMFPKNVYYEENKVVVDFGEPISGKIILTN
jgi:hypothetical protein